MKQQLASVAGISASRVSLGGKRTKYSKHVCIVLAVVITLYASPMAWGEFINGGFETGDLTGLSSQYGNENVEVVEYEYANDSLGLSQPPYTTAPDGRPAWRPTEGNYFLSIKGSNQFEFFERPTGEPLAFSFDWFFDGDDSAGATVFLSTCWDLMCTNESTGRLITINVSAPAEETYVLV